MSTTSSNSSIMSYGPLAQNYTIQAPAGMAICADYQNTSSTMRYPTAYVLPGSTVNITFGGSPPYNVSTAYLPYNGISTCGANWVTLNSSSYLWVVGNNRSTFGASSSYGDAFVLYAMETSQKDSQGYYSIYPSDYFVLSNNTNSSGGLPVGSSGSGKSSGIKEGASYVAWKAAIMVMTLGLAAVSLL